MFSILSITLPIFIIMGMGYFAVRFDLFTMEQLSGMGKFVVRIGLPMLVFHAIATRPMNEVLNLTYLLGYGLASLLSFFIGWGISRWRGQDATLASLNGLANGMSNTGFIGFPLLTMAVGAPAGVFFAMNVLVENMLVLPLMFIMIDAAQGGGKNIGATLLRIGKNLLKNPIIMALLVSLVFAVFEIPVPGLAEKVSMMLASASSPLALFVIGGGLYGLSMRGNLKDIGVITAGKLLMFPMLVLGCLWLLGADKETLFAGALLASVPMASMYPIFGQQYGFPRETAAAMLATTLWSFFSISLVLAVGH